MTTPAARGVGDGTLSLVVWPTHAGAVQSNGEEPMFGLDYRRGQITWELNADGALEGRAIIEVPDGEWAWIIYAHNGYRPGFVTTQKLVHPLVLREPGVITLTGITEDDVSPLHPDPILHD